ncbi:MAG: S41 family peptidase [Bacteroidetes bacterium]|nr:S41 family peptidase [Bacteroidota bacterium]
MILKNKKYRKARRFIFLAATVFVSIISFSFVDDYFEVSKNLDIFSSLYREVNIHYVDSTNPAKLMKTGIDAMLGSLDPYTNYIPESARDDYRFMTTGQYGGIGAVIRQKGDYIAISEPYEGFPAQKADLRTGDEILEIDSTSVKGKKTDEVSKLLKGKPKTTVRLLIRREGEKKPLEKMITREEIKVKSVPYYGMISNGIGYIKLTNFTESAGKEMSEALKSLKEKNKLKGIILDIRSNPGGLLNEAVNISNVFVDRGQDIVSTRGKLKGDEKIYKAINSAVDTELPLAVLVNSSSASASEIVSGSLQDLDRGVIIGQRTFGKGLVQTTRQLSYNTQVKITTAKYYIPSGRCIQALDYTHRNEDGSVGKIPDSLRTEFRTKAGRKVYDGGGILPDVSTEPKKYSNIATSLLNKNLVFDFATHYRLQHASIPDGKIFRLTDTDFSDFLEFIADKEYDYTTRSEKTLDDLKKNTEDEKYFSDIKTEFDALRVKLIHNKKEDVKKNKEEIMQLLEEEIVSRYYYQNGRIEATFEHDREIMKAVEILGNHSVYASILDGTVKASEELPKK